MNKEMLEFSKKFVLKLPKVDGFILKGKSPTCGIKEVLLGGTEN